MYRCEICHEVVPAKTKAQRVVVETRPRVYPFRKEANRRVWKKSKWEKTDNEGGTGFEIVREVIACPSCAERLRQNM